MAAAIVDTNAPIFAKLDSQLKAGQRRKALRTIEEVLKALPGDTDALHVKAVLLIELDKFDDALKLCETRSLSSQLWYEKAYCLYRQGNLEQSLDALDTGSDPGGSAALQLRAQLLYRMGRFDAAVKAYEQLCQDNKTVGAEVKTNIVAAYAASTDPQRFEPVAKALGISPKDSFETAFNMACIRLQAGDLEQARELLLLGTRSGRESLLDEDYTEKQVEQELAPLSVQLALVAAHSGHHFDALEQYQEALNWEVSDEGIRAVTINNFVAQKIITCPPSRLKPAVQEAFKLFDTLFEKGTGSKLKAAVVSRLSSSQQEALLVNRLLLLLLAGKNSVARDVLQQLTKGGHGWPSLQTARAAVLLRERKSQEAENLLQSLSSQAPTQLLQAQIALELCEHNKAANILSSVEAPDLLGKPAFIISSAAVLEAAGKADEALRLVSSTQAKHAPGADQEILPVLARLQLKVGDVKSAFQTFKRLKAVDSSAASAGVVGRLAGAALSQDPAAATLLEGHLEALPEIPQDAVASLESAGTKRLAKGEAGQREGAAKKRKRKKQRRLPKGFDPDNPGPPPDPERWLPKWQRAEFKKKRRSRKDKDKAKAGHQGGAVDESLDRTNTEVPAAAPNLPKRARAKGKAGRR